VQLKLIISEIADTITNRQNSGKTNRQNSGKTNIQDAGKTNMQDSAKTNIKLRKKDKTLME